MRGITRCRLLQPQQTQVHKRLLRRRFTSSPGRAESFDFETAVNRRTDAESSVKWGRYGEGVLPMWIADMDFRAAPCVIDALHERVQHGVFGYASPSAGLNTATIEYLQRRHGWQVDPAWIVWLPGLVPALNMACQVAGEKGDSVLVPCPVYTPFLHAPRNNGRQLHPLPLLPLPAAGGSRQQQQGRAATTWELDWDAMDAAVSPESGEPRPCAFLLCNPHNPTGHCWPERTLQRLGEWCIRHDVLLCSDEVHADLVLDPTVRHVPVGSLSPEIGQASISLFAASKTCECGRVRYLVLSTVACGLLVHTMLC